MGNNSGNVVNKVKGCGSAPGSGSLRANLKKGIEVILTYYPENFAKDEDIIKHAKSYCEKEGLKGLKLHLLSSDTIVDIS